ncbi:MAG: zinc ABC transporter substrate-binding protein [Muribaculaceae bacterium]|nr:zinc ABC transporter substrate-binding protein [Muribaculaceae bacterium]
MTGIGKFGIWTVLAGLLVAGGSCAGGPKHNEKPCIAVSVAPQAALVKAIAGDEYEILTVLEKGSDPETFEPGMQTRLAADKSLAYLNFGGLLSFENQLTQSLKGDVRVYNTARGIELEYGTHGEAHNHHDTPDGHDGADPHVWTSTVNLSLMAENIRAALAELNPTNAAEYAARAMQLQARLDSMDQAFRTRLENAPSRSFAVWHPSLSYFARDYGLKQIALGQEHKELSAKRMKELSDSAAAEGTRVFFLQREYDPRQAETANERIGSRLVIITPLSEDWKGQMELIVDELTR